MKKEKPLPDKKVEELLRKYGPRIKRIPFTIDGIPTDEERNLTKDIWNSLDAETKKKILDKTRNVIASERKIKPEKIKQVQNKLIEVFTR